MLSMDKVSMSYLFSFLRYQAKCLIKFLYRKLMRLMRQFFEIYLRSTSKTVADGEKEGKTEIQKFEYLKNEKSFLDETKIIFRSF